MFFRSRRRRSTAMTEAPTGAQTADGYQAPGGSTAMTEAPTGAQTADGYQAPGGSTATATTTPRSPSQAPEGRRRRRISRRQRSREAGAAAVGAAGSGVLALARLVMVIAGLIVLLIVLAIVLRDVDANAGNSIVKGIHEGANFFAGSFTGLIAFAGHPKRAITIDWGIAALAYLIVGAILSAAIGRIGLRGKTFGYRHGGPVASH
jgi:hypothetical protein